MKSSIIIKAIKQFNNHSVLPILEDVFLNKDTLQVTDLETALVIPYKTNVSSCLPIVSFCTVLESLDSPVFKMEGKKTTATAGKQKISLQHDEPDNYPRLIADERKNYKKVGNFTPENISDLLCGLQFASNDDLRPAMTCVQIHKFIASTDAHRLVMLPMKKAFKEEVLLGKKVIKLMEVLGGEWTVELSKAGKDRKTTFV